MKFRLTVPIEINKKVNGCNVRPSIHEPQPVLPPDFSWETLDVFKDLPEISSFLLNNYICNENNGIKLVYTPECILWALAPPGYIKEWHVAIKNNGKICAMITGIPLELVVFSEKVLFAGINFLCVSKKLRSNKFTPLLVRELSRRLSLHNCQQAMATTNFKIPNSLSEINYYHRYINYKKLVDLHFTDPPKVSLNRMLKFYSIPSVHLNYRSIKLTDIPLITKLLNDFLSKTTDIRIHFTEELAAHTFLSKGCSTYIKDTNDCFFSYYSLSSIMNDTEIKTAYLYYCVHQNNFESIMNDAVVCASENGFDLVNCINICGKNEMVLKKLKFVLGNGLSYYYLYNWKSNKITSERNGIYLI